MTSRSVRFRSLVVATAGALLLSHGALAQKRAEIPTDDGGKLVVSTWAPEGTPKGAALLLPARRSNRFAFGPLVDRMRGTSLLIVALDRRGQGESSGAPESDGAASRPAADPFERERADVALVLKMLEDLGAPKDAVAFVAAGDASGLAASVAARSADVPKAMIFLTPDDEGLGTLDAAVAELRRMAPRALMVVASEEDAAKGADAFSKVLTFPEAEHRVLKRTLVHGAAVFGKEPGFEATLTQWILEALAAPRPIEIRESIFVVVDGDPAPHEAIGASFVEIPLGDVGVAKVRVTRSKRTLDLAFDVPERCLRLNEVSVFVDGSGEGPRLPNASCYAVSYAPKDGTRAPVLVRRGGLRGFEDSDALGVAAFSRTTEKSRWTAELALDLDRFVGGNPPRAIRIGFQIKGAKPTDVRNWPDLTSTPTSPRAWAKASVR
jgi:hypothetical protein